MNRDGLLIGDDAFDADTTANDDDDDDGEDDDNLTMLLMITRSLMIMTTRAFCAGMAPFS